MCQTGKQFGWYHIMVRPVLQTGLEQLHTWAHSPAVVVQALSPGANLTANTDNLLIRVIIGNLEPHTHSNSYNRKYTIINTNKYQQLKPLTTNRLPEVLMVTTSSACQVPSCCPTVSSPCYVACHSSWWRLWLVSACRKAPLPVGQSSAHWHKVITLFLVTFNDKVSKLCESLYNSILKRYSSVIHGLTHCDIE